MKFRVRIAPPAIAEALAIHAHISKDSPLAGDLWFAGLMDSIDTLGEYPRRCRRAPESRYFRGDIRHLLYQSHRILFTIRAGEVRVLHVHHAARQPRRPSR